VTRDDRSGPLRPRRCRAGSGRHQSWRPRQPGLRGGVDVDRRRTHGCRACRSPVPV